MSQKTIQKLIIRIDWENRDWDNEVKMFAPKRKVNNKRSWERPHIIGSFYSEKMHRVFEYKSLNEHIFCSVFEMDKQVKAINVLSFEGMKISKTNIAKVIGISENILYKNKNMASFLE